MERLNKVYPQDVVDVVEIWVDTQTGVNDVFTEMETLQVLHHYLIERESTNCDTVIFPY